MRVDVAAGTQLHGLHSMRGSPSAILRMTAMDSKPIDILLARGGRSRVRQRSLPRSRPLGARVTQIMGWNLDGTATLFEGGIGRHQSLPNQRAGSIGILLLILNRLKLAVWIAIVTPTTKTTAHLDGTATIFAGGRNFTLNERLVLSIAQKILQIVGFK